MNGQTAEKKRYIYLILAGLAVIALTYRLDSGVSYGMRIGENEGVASYIVTQAVTVYVGTHLMIDVFFDPIGYALIIAGFALMGKNAYSSRGIIMASIGAAGNVLMLTLPLFMEVDRLVLPLVVLHLLQVLSASAIMYALMGICTKKIDNYKYMQVRKDLKFAAELYGVCMVVGKILQLFTRADWYFSRMLYAFVAALCVAVMAYYIVKVRKYMRMLDMY